MQVLAQGSIVKVSLISIMSRTDIIYKVKQRKHACKLLFSYHNTLQYPHICIEVRTRQGKSCDSSVEQLPSGTSGVINTHDQHSFIKHPGLGKSGASILFGFNKTDALFNILLLDSSNWLKT